MDDEWSQVLKQHNDPRPAGQQTRQIDQVVDGAVSLISPSRKDEEDERDYDNRASNNRPMTTDDQKPSRSAIEPRPSGIRRLPFYDKNENSRSSYSSNNLTATNENNENAGYNNRNLPRKLQYSNSDDQSKNNVNYWTSSNNIKSTFSLLPFLSDNVTLLIVVGFALSLVTVILITGVVQFYYCRSGSSGSGGSDTGNDRKTGKGGGSRKKSSLSQRKTSRQGQKVRGAVTAATATKPYARQISSSSSGGGWGGNRRRSSLATMPICVNSEYGWSTSKRLCVNCPTVSIPRPF